MTTMVIDLIKGCSPIGSLVRALLLSVVLLVPNHALAMSDSSESQTGPNKIKVAVASNFAPLLQSIVDSYHAQTNAQVIIVSGSSAKLYAQISHGAPFDLFLSADQIKPQLLIDNGLADAASRFTYAIGQLVLWSPHHPLPDNAVQALANNNFHKLAIANPKLAPYGEAAIEFLTHLRFMQSLKSKLIKGENIAQTYQFVLTGNVDIGLVAWSQVVGSQVVGSQVIDSAVMAKSNLLTDGYSTNHYWLIPQSYYRPIKQDAVLLSRSKHNAAAKQFLRFLQSPAISAKIEARGYARGYTRDHTPNHTQN